MRALLITIALAVSSASLHAAQNPSADPLADIHNTTQIQSVWLRGKYFDRAALDQLLAPAKHRHGKSRID